MGTNTEQPADNLRHWAGLERTDPKYTKPFTRSGGFRGTDINPTWRIKRMTEHFGPVGIGWGTTEPHFDMVQEEAGRVVYCRVGIWYRDGDQKSEPVWGVGGDVVSGKRSSGQAFVDDEAQKKAFTDALGNAMKSLGVSADVFLKLFDDSKYRAESEEAYAAKREEPANLEKLRSDAAALKAGISATESLDDLTAYWREHTAQIRDLPKALRDELTAHAGAHKTALQAEPNTIVGAGD